MEKSVEQLKKERDESEKQYQEALKKEAAPIIDRAFRDLGALIDEGVEVKAIARKLKKLLLAIDGGSGGADVGDSAASKTSSRASKVFVDLDTAAAEAFLGLQKGEFTKKALMQHLGLDDNQSIKTKVWNEFLSTKKIKKIGAGAGTKFVIKGKV